MRRFNGKGSDESLKFVLQGCSPLMTLAESEMQLIILYYFSHNTLCAALVCKDPRSRLQGFYGSGQMGYGRFSLRRLRTDKRYVS